jgi:hypothetical protein
MELSDLQFAILDSLYFVEPFDKILEEAGYPENLVGAELRQMISRRWVQPMRFDKELNDFVRSNIHDVDDMRAFSYLATKEGLLRHNGRR